MDKASLIFLAVFSVFASNFIYPDIVWANEIADSNPIPLFSEWNEQQAKEWEDASQKIRAIDKKDIPESRKCQERFDIMWSLSKSGNLEARYFIYRVLNLGYWLQQGEHQLAPALRKRVEMLLFMHSLGAPSLTNDIWEMKNLKIVQVTYPGMSEIMSHASVHQCILETPSQLCTRMMLEQSLIIPFAEFADEVDGYIKNGMAVSCADSFERKN